MLTALTVKNEKAEKWYERLLNKIRGNSIDVDIKSARGVALRHITYINRNGSVNWFAIENEIGDSRDRILCDESVLLPENMGFTRFENTVFKARLSCNLGLYVLSKISGEAPGIKAALYDVKGNCCDYLKSFFNYAGDGDGGGFGELCVITDNRGAYEKAAAEIMDESGAAVFISDRRDNLFDCALIIAPERIEESLPVSGGAIVLTGFAPTVCTPGLVYFDYHFRMPNMFDRIKPESLSCEYFAGALFSKGRQYELGSIVPTTCSNLTSSQTPRSICDYLLRTAR